MEIVTIPFSPAEIPQSWNPCRRPTLHGLCGDDLSDPETGFYNVLTCEKCDEEIALLQSLDAEAEAMDMAEANRDN